MFPGDITFLKKEKSFPLKKMACNSELHARFYNLKNIRINYSF